MDSQPSGQIGMVFGFQRKILINMLLLRYFTIDQVYSITQTMGGGGV